MRGASEADRRQRESLDPSASVWVSASAGTGKTKVLTERLLNLMLAGTPPSRILCLTFTRAAAAEMSNRVNDRLAKWTVLPRGELAQELVDLTGRYPNAEDLAHARQLFARVLDAPGGAKIETIHAFCQSLLRRFPLEAQVPPEFAVIDERSAAEALSDAAAAIIAAARIGARPMLAEALSVVARYLAEDRFAELIAGLARERGKLGAALADGEAALAARLAAAIGIGVDDTVDRLATAFCSAGDLNALRAACGVLAAGSKTNRERGAIIGAWCAHADNRPAMLEDYLAAFLTDKGNIRKQLSTKGLATNPACDAARILLTEAERAKRFLETRNGIVTLEATLAIARLGEALNHAYETRKRLHAQLDYDDLVLKALDLLHRPGIAPWVLFKLDGGLDHILIDEAQDTNREQWEIVALLAAEFFAGDDPLGRERTVFAVGDAKQSIYSFQRADPRAFVEMRQHFQDRVNDANRLWRPVSLEVSFRAAPPLLRAVDAAFAQAIAADGVALDGEAIHHIAHRIGQAGLVELWPPVPAPPNDSDDPDTGEAPGRRVAEPRTRLARAIAATIANWLERGERLASRDRPIRPGDIMVLLRRRNEFVPDLLRALKDRDVPVAGADRMRLAEHLAVSDLVALGRFLLLPEDDLTLAVVLKGPLFGISEEQLFALAHDRGGQSLWSRLQRRADSDLLFNSAAKMLTELLRRADFSPPYDLYAELLGARGGRRAMLERLGPDAEDPIEEFLALALGYEREHVPSLQGFLHWLVAGEIEVKRDFAERQRNEVRIMTVHGAKGLEAPIVFLPDTMQLPDTRVPILWTEADDLPLWRPHADFTTAYYTAERLALRRRELQEYRRLLYVALTRAQDRLYVCGWQNQRAVNEAESWHALCAAGWKGLADRILFDTKPLIGERDGWSGEGLRLTSAQTAEPVRDAADALTAPIGAPPAWFDRPPPPEPSPPRPLLPSEPVGGEPAVLSPLAVSGRDRFKRGILVHRLLQALPELPVVDREAAARRFLALPMHALAADEQADICRETLRVIDAPEFAPLWGPGAQAEVPIVGLIGGHALSGQIDRLVATPDRVLVVDYKTVRPPPETAEDVAPLYLRQLAIYRAALQRIYADRDIDCAILWTVGPRLMPISPELLARHLP